MDNVDIINWLLEEKNPAVKYYTMNNLTEVSNKELAVAFATVNEDPIIKSILACQNEDGSWSQKERFYTDKYHGTIWQLLILAQLGANGNDPPIKKSSEFVLEHSQDSETMGFSVEMSKKTGHGLPSKVTPCLTGNMVYALIRLGYFNDKRVKGAIDWLVKYQTSNDGVATTTNFKYSKHDACFGKHTCFMGVVKSLKAFSVIPVEHRSVKIDMKIAELVEFMLCHHLYRKSHNLNQKAKPGWTRFGFPLMYQTDLLEILEIFSDLGIIDNRMKEAYDIVESKRQNDGTWKMQNTFNGKMIVDIESKNENSKWITAKAMKVLHKYHKDFSNGS
jgi:hypothetical protein